MAEVVTSAVLLLGLYQVQQRSVPFMRAFTQALGMSRRYSTTGEPLADSDTPKAGTRYSKNAQGALEPSCLQLTAATHLRPKCSLVCRDCQTAALVLDSGVFNIHRSYPKRSVPCINVHHARCCAELRDCLMSASLHAASPVLSQLQ